MTLKHRIVANFLAFAGLAAVVADSVADAVVVAESPAIYAHPTGISLDQPGQLLYVADSGHNEIKVLVASNLDLLGEFGKKQLRRPQTTTLVGDNELLVADSGHDRLVNYAVNGTSAKISEVFTTHLKGVYASCRLNDTTIVATTAGGNHLVTVNSAGISQTTATGIGANIPFFKPAGVACDTVNQQIYMADSGNDRVVVLDQKLEVKAIIGGRKLALNQPSDVSISDDGLIFIADRNNDRIVVLNHRHTLVDSFGDDILTRPASLVRRGDRVWVTDTFAERIVLFEWQSPTNDRLTNDRQTNDEAGDTHLTDDSSGHKTTKPTDRVTD